MSNTEKDKKDILTEIKNNPVKILALIYPYILIVGVGIGLFYLANVNDIQKQSLQPVLQDSLAQMPPDLTVEMPKSVPKADVITLSQPSDSMIAAGKVLFNTNCASCHGADGKGDGVAASGLKPSPRNFTSKENWINGPKLTGIFKTLSEGIQGSAMVAFDSFTPAQKFELAQYIRSAFVPDPPKDSDEELTDLSQTYHLSEAQKTPGQIPVKDAIKLVSSEMHSRYQEVLDILKKINTDDQEQGAGIFKKVTNDKIKALTMLSSTDEWKNNKQIFIDLIVDELNDAGFNDNVHNLSVDNWNTLYNYMSKTIQ